MYKVYVLNLSRFLFFCSYGRCTMTGDVYAHLSVRYIYIYRVYVVYVYVVCIIYKYV